MTQLLSLTLALLLAGGLARADDDDSSADVDGEQDEQVAEAGQEPSAATESSAAAEPAAASGSANLGVLVGYGLSMLGAGTLTTDNPYGVGFGAQLDYQLPVGLVLGVGADFFLGETTPQSTDAMGMIQPEHFARYLLVHGRLGWNLRMDALGGKLDVRPSVWLGAAFATVSVDATQFPDGHANAFLLAPGISVHYWLSESGWYVGEDIRVSLPLGAHVRNGVLLLLTVGKHL
jgi:opacity protein-like surface antigen